MTPEVKERIEQIRHGIVPEGYKKVGSDIFPVDWNKVAFSDIGIIASGLVDPQIPPYLHMQHIGPDNIEKNTGRILETQSATELGLISGKFYFDTESIVYSKIRPNLNKVCAPPFEGICSADCYSIKPTKKADKAFLLNLMLGYSFYKRAVACSMRTGMPKINQDDLNMIPMCCPTSICEQQKIAEILTAQDKVIELKEKLLAEKQRQKKYMAKQVFDKGQNTIPLTELAFITMGQSPASESYNTSFDGIPLIQGNADILNRKPSPRMYTTAPTKMCCAGDILISVRAPVGTVARSTISACIGRGICSIRPQYMSDYIYEYLLYYEDKWGRVSQGSTFESISGDDIGKLQIPQCDESNKTAKMLTVAGKEIELLRKSIEQEKQKKKALMQLLLTGVVRVKI